MAQAIRVGIAGAGWPGKKHAEGYRAAGGFELTAVADLIPARRSQLMAEGGFAREYANYAELLADPGIDAVSICLPNYLHLPAALAALKAKKHVLVETPPFLNGGEARKAHAAATRAKKVLMYAAQRPFGAGALAARQAIDKGYLGEVHHASARWMRTRGIPRGTGWFTRREQSGGGALIDLGLPMLDLAWKLLGQPRPRTVFMIQGRAPTGAFENGENACDVETSAFALLSFENGKSMELAASWAINQPPRHHGTVCRISGDAGAVELDTPDGPVLYRSFGAGGKAKEISLKLPKVAQYHAMMREFKDCIAGKAPPSAPSCGGEQAMTLMQIIDAAYKSAQTGKSIEIRTAARHTEAGV
jgi:predicted dehydrogenase